MANAVEKPVVDESTAKPEKKIDEAESKQQIDDLIEALKTADVTTVDQLEGKLSASQQVGHMQNMLGEERAEKQRLLETIQNMSTTKPTQQQTTSFDDVSEGQQVDLDSLVARNVEKVLDKRDKAAAQAQTANLQKYHKIMSDRNYPKVKKVWEEKLKDPQFVFEITNGIKDSVDAYREIVDDFKDGLLKQSLDTITALTGTGKPTTSPHVEGETTVSHNLPDEKSDASEAIDKLQQEVDKGKQLTEQEQLDALGKVLGGEL